MKLFASYGTSDGAVRGIELGTSDGIADDGAVFDTELVRDYGTSDDALLGHATVVVLFGLADDATTVGGAAAGIATDSITMVLCLTRSSL